MCIMRILVQQGVEMDLTKLLLEAIHSNASDLHLSSGEKPAIRVNAELIYLEKPELSEEDLLAMLKTIMTDEQYKQFMKDRELDMSYVISGGAIFRINLFHQARGAAAVFRVIPFEIPTLESLNMPSTLQNFCDFENGLVLLTGPTGSGKSTTLAAMINHINKQKNIKKHIITIEDPIEYVYESENCLINQREVGKDTLSFANALRCVLREDPDIILIGEMRDIETIRLALTAAETGHLVLATLHTNSAAKAIDRIIDSFPGDEKDMIRSMVSESLRAVVAQKLVKLKDKDELMAATEVMVCTPAVRNLIRENKIAQLYSAMQTGRSHGMWTLEQDIERLVDAGIIEPPNDFNVDTL